MDESIWSLTSIRKARRLLSEDRVTQDPDYPSVWWVNSPNSPDRRYRVQTDSKSWVTCTCPHGLNRGGSQTRCYHALSVLMKINGSDFLT